MEALGIDPALLASQIVNFLLLVLVLRFVLYKPILNMLQERREKIKESLQYAEQVKQEAAAEREKHQKELEEAHRKAEEAIAQASQISEQEREKIVAEAQEEARRILEQARAEIEHERRQAMIDLQEQVVELAIAAASKVIDQSLDEKEHRRLIKEFLAEASDLE
ncbi:MAG: F0F1 ATP synthase subunit B [Anaerolineae bacterium]